MALHSCIKARRMPVDVDRVHIGVCVNQQLRHAKGCILIIIKLAMKWSPLRTWFVHSHCDQRDQRSLIEHSSVNQRGAPGINGIDVDAVVIKCSITVMSLLYTAKCHGGASHRLKCFTFTTTRHAKSNGTNDSNGANICDRISHISNALTRSDCKPTHT
jgi:hypothetical protein